MFNFDQPFTGIYRSSDEILAHPRFPGALTAFIEAILRLYEGDPLLTRLLVEAGRQVMFSIIICLHVRYDGADRATWPTMGLLKQSMTQFGLSSPRRIEDLVARLIRFGFLKGDYKVDICGPSPYIHRERGRHDQHDHYSRVHETVSGR